MYGFCNSNTLYTGNLSFRMFAFTPFFIAATLSKNCYQKWAVPKKMSREDGHIRKGSHGRSGFKPSAHNTLFIYIYIYIYIMLKGEMKSQYVIGMLL